ncbi:MAG: hypothetical protein V1897_01225 [Pseudomonadota bacterium]
MERKGAMMLPFFLPIREWNGRLAGRRGGKKDISQKRVILHSKAPFYATKTRLLTSKMGGAIFNSKKELPIWYCEGICLNGKGEIPDGALGLGRGGDLVGRRCSANSELLGERDNASMALVLQGP